MQDVRRALAPLRKSTRRLFRDIRTDVGWKLSLYTARFRLLPSFIIIGTQKGGTSSLYEYLTQHPWILPARKKEIHFFDTADFAWGIDWYRAHFQLGLPKNLTERAARRNVLTGEASPYYLPYPHSAQRIAKMLPDVGLIVMLRDPVDRALSHYYHQVRKGREQLSFEAAIEAEMERLCGEYDRMLQDETYYSYPYWAYSYLARGIYVDQLKHWLKVFPREQFLFIKSEDFFADPSSSFKRTLRFLGIPEIDLADYKKQNAGTYSGMSQEVRRKLREYFRPYNERLYDLLGIDFAWGAVSQEY